MKYQQLIDKYSNPNYQSHGNLRPPNITNSSHKLDVPSKSHYAAELEQLERSNHYRNKSRNKNELSNAFETKSTSSHRKSPRHFNQNKVGDSSKESIFRNMHSDTLPPSCGSRTPRNIDKQDDLRKTTGTDWSFHDRIDKYTPQFNVSGGFPPSSFYTEEFKHNNSRSGSKINSNYELCRPEFLLEKKYSDGNKYSTNIHSTKENYPPVGDEFYSSLTMSSNTKKSPIPSSLTSSKYESHRLESSVSTNIKPFDLRGATSDVKRLDSPTASPRLEASSSKKQFDLRMSSQASSKFSLDKNGLFVVQKPKSPTNLRKEDFQIGKCKGDGKFGKVFPCRHIATGSLYALKQIPKKLIKQNMMEDQLVREIKIQSYFNHGNLVKLYGFFSDETNIYLLMEYMEEGTLYTLLKKHKKFPEAYVSDRIRELCTALHYLHDMDVVHRDIKLENIVLSNGVAKLCDFGWAALIDGRRTTYCGTFDYAPPEIIEGKDYNQNVDLWSLGVMTFEMLTGQLPFYNISRSETIKNILNVDNKKINFPPDTSSKAQDFIEKLLRKNPLERIRIDTLLKHPFLAVNPNSKSYV